MSREDAEEGPRDNSYREEAAWLSGRGPAPKRIHKTQVLGLEAAAAAPFAASGGGAFLEPATAVLAARRLYREGKLGRASTRRLSTITTPVPTHFSTSGCSAPVPSLRA